VQSEHAYGLEASLSRRNERLHALVDVGRELATAEDTEAVLAGFFEKAVRQLGFALCLSFSVQEGGAFLHLEACAGLTDAARAELSQIPLSSRSPCARAAVLRTSVFSERVQASDEPALDTARALGVRAFACQPVLSRDQQRLVRVLAFGTRSSDRFEASEMEFMQTLAHFLAGAHERVAAERALHVNEALKSAVLESALDCIVAMDKEGCVVEWNPAAERTFGYTREGALGCDMAELIIPPEQREAHRRGLARYLSTGAGPVLGRRVEVEALRADGTRFPVELAITPTPGGNALFTAYLRDITERRQTVAALRESEAHFRAIADNIPQMAWMARPDGSRYWYNQRWYDYTGMSVDAADGLGWQSIHHPDHLPRVLDGMREAWAAGRAWEDTFPLKGKDGAFRWFLTRAAPVRDALGRVVLWFGTNTDITERNLAEAKLRESEGRLREALEAGEMGSWQLDLTTRTVTRDDRLLQLCGLPASAAIDRGEAFEALLHPDDRGTRDAARDRAILDGTQYRAEFRIRRADTGEERWLAARGGVLRGPDGRPERLVGVNYDITERKRAEERQILLMREVDHRAKNVLAVVQSLISLSDRGDPARFSETVEGRVAALARAHTLLARDRWTGADLRQVFEHEVEAYRGAGRFDLDGPALQLRPDAVQPLSMAVHELATNAAKHGALSSSGGQVTISWHVEPESEGGRVRIRWIECGGPPLPGPPGWRGFGSTLLETTVKDQLGGEIRKQWRRDGLHCEITLASGHFVATSSPDPVKQELGEHLPEAPRPDRGSTRRPRILVVEDEVVIGLDLVRMLTQAGFEAIGPAAVFETALRLVETEAGRLDAAVLDLNLRGKSSLPLAELLARQGVPVVFVTGYGQVPAGTTLNHVRLGKPIRAAELKAALSRLIGAGQTAAEGGPVPVR